MSSDRPKHLTTQLPTKPVWTPPIVTYYVVDTNNEEHVILADDRSCPGSALFFFMKGQMIVAFGPTFWKTMYQKEET